MRLTVAFLFMMVMAALTGCGGSGNPAQTTSAVSTTNTYAISGKVASDGIGIDGATVTISSPAATNIPSVQTYGGVFSFAFIPNGTYTLSCTKPGWSVATQTITVNGANVDAPDLTISRLWRQIGRLAGDQNAQGRAIIRVAIDPQNNQNIYATTILGVFKTTDGGASWSAINSGLPNQPAVGVAVDPHNSQKVYATVSGGGAFASTDGGASWNAINSGISTLDLADVVIDESNSQIIYAGSKGGGVFKSSNGGVSWSAVNNGITDLNISALVIDPTNSQRIFAGSYGGLFKSTNGGASWNRIDFSNGLQNLYVTGVAVAHYSGGNCIYAATYGGGVFKSTDGGNYWQAASKGITNLFVTSLAISPSLVYENLSVGTWGDGIFRSYDGGQSWSAASSGMSDMDLYVSTLVMPDSWNIYAGTISGGVFQQSW